MNLTKLMEEFLETQSSSKDEWYASDKTVAKYYIEKFIEWVEARNE